MQLRNLQRIYSYKDYLNSKEGEHFEILDGVPYMQSAPSRIHQKISGKLHLKIGNYLEGKACEVYLAPFCVRLDISENYMDIKNVVEPDLTIICDKSKLDDKGCLGSPDMIIEILSPTSGKMDMFYKLNKYERAGVAEYWIINPEAKLLSVFLLQPNGRYGRTEMYTEEDKVRLKTLPELEIDLKTIFQETMFQETMFRETMFQD